MEAVKSEYAEMNNTQPLIFSFFSGSGFLDLGFEDNGFEIAFVNEYHQPFLDAYKHSRAKMGYKPPRYGYDNQSIEKVVDKGSEAERFAIKLEEARSTDRLIGFIGGPPCPDFSIAGKNKGKEGENGKLSKVYVDAIVRHSPDFFVFENVKGLWRTARHREFYDQLKRKLSRSGYLLTNRLTNCIEYGAPQDRDRILLFGVKKSLVKSQNSKQLEQHFDWEANISNKLDEVFREDHWPSQEAYAEDGLRKSPSCINGFKHLTVQHWFEKNDVGNHPNASHYFTPRAALPKFQTIAEGDDSKKSFKRLHRWRYSPTAAYGNNEVHLHPYKSRRISAAEALAIQSLPKNFELPSDMSLTNMFKTIGNGVPYVASSGLAKTILDYLNEFTH